MPRAETSDFAGAGGEHRCRRERGFSLAETIAALALVAGAVVLLAQASGAGWRGIRKADSSQKTLHLARSLLATVGTERPLVAGRSEGGEPDGTTWVIAIEPEATAVPLPARLRVMPFRVQVSVLPPGGGDVRLTSLMVGRRP